MMQYKRNVTKIALPFETRVVVYIINKFSFQQKSCTIICD